MNSTIRSKLIAIIALLFFVALNINASEPRILRSIGNPVVMPEGLGADEDSLIQYNTLNDLGYYWTIPNEDNDKYYNVGFTSPYESFRLLEARIPLFDIQDEGGNSLIGRPGLRVIIWESHNIDDEDTLFPGEAIDSIDIPFDDLTFGFDTIFVNQIDLRELNITFQRNSEFHIGVDVIDNDSTQRDDILAIYSDFLDEIDRSRLLEGHEGEWVRTSFLQVDGEHRMFNYGIWALVTDQVSAPILLEPNNAAQLFTVDPAYPNPFNDKVKVHFSVQPGLPYSAILLDHLGRQVQIVDKGIGYGESTLQISGADLAAGAYYFRMFAGNKSSSQRLIYLK
ncbi:MAG: T9SS type A sorting domain-containing protein [Candidatus Hatepunaea meridiana]|nr:T9SS type A sorting domain-containing protein [Candidatus Hatepunaea meridiana]